MSSPDSSRPETFDLAVVALSARALAASARRAGLRALAIDLFADADTQVHAALAVRAEASRRGLGFARKSLLETLATHAPAGLPVVLGAGFEHAPALMRAIAARNPILGATADQVKLLKDPFAFAGLLRELGVAHPPIRSKPDEPQVIPAPRQRGGWPFAKAKGRVGTWGIELDDDLKRLIRNDPHPTLPFARGGIAPFTEKDQETAPDGVWLSKRVGASGGAHIRFGNRARPAGGRYLQAYVPGRAVSALFLADGRSTRIVGFSEQWTDPAPRRAFRYGGAVGPIALPGRLAENIASALDRIVAATALTGLASADMIVSDDGASFHLLEINPRPGATLDVFDHDETSLIRLHLDACAGRLPAAPPSPAEARAAAVVYAERPVQIVTLRRPLWTADWPSCDETLPAGAPVCTVLASAATPSEAYARVTERRAALLASIRAAQKAAPTNAMVPA